MILRLSHGYSMAAIAILAVVSPAWGQMPSHRVSPWNQLGRAWGWGISDGYHECPDCDRRKVQPISQSDCPKCADGESLSIFSRLNPFKDSSSKADGNSAVVHRARRPATTVQPPSPQMYQQFTLPHETPLPGSSYSPGAMHDQPTTSIQDPIPVTPATPVPDPIESERWERVDEKNEPTLIPDSEAVPPAPVLFRQRKGDVPLGEEPNNPPSESSSPTPKTETDDNLNLLSKDNSSPNTIQLNPNGRSLIRGTPAEVRQPTPVASPSNSDWLSRHYYGNAYSQPNSPVELEANRRVVNRYR